MASGPIVTTRAPMTGNTVIVHVRLTCPAIWLTTLRGLARGLVARFEGEPHVNPNTGTREFSLRGPDGDDVTMSALSVTWSDR